MKRNINAEKLKELIIGLGENAFAKASVATGVSISTLQQMVAGTYPSQPQEQLRFKIVKALNADMEELFPLEEEVS